jgi:hypothetical protein
MIKKNGKHVTYTDKTKKARLDALKIEIAKNKGKFIQNLTKRELEGALTAALKLLELADEQGVIQ